MNKHERLVERLFAERYTLALRRIPEGDVPTPDFDVLDGETHVAVLEVKALEFVAPVVTVKRVVEADTDFLAGALGNDNGAGRVAKKIHEAVQQFRDSPHPRILVLVNDGLDTDKNDLREALLGYLTYGGERVYTFTREVSERLAADRGKIDLYAWVEVFDDHRVQWVSTDGVGRDLRQRFFDWRGRSRAGSTTSRN